MCDENVYVDVSLRECIVCGSVSGLEGNTIDSSMSETRRQRASPGTVKPVETTCSVVAAPSHSNSCVIVRHT